MIIALKVNFYLHNENSEYHTSQGKRMSSWRVIYLTAARILVAGN